MPAIFDVTRTKVKDFAEFAASLVADGHDGHIMVGFNGVEGVFWVVDG